MLKYVTVCAVSLCGLLATMPGTAADKAVPTKALAKGKSGERTSPREAKETTSRAEGSGPWSPPAYPEAEGRLPTNYRGIDEKRFFELFQTKVDAAKKGEFETSDAFTQRIANPAALLSPISMDALYAFKIEDFSSKYDADTQKYLLSAGNGNLCDPEDAWVICDVRTLVDRTETYEASNAYGAKFTVEQIYGRFLSLAFTRGPTLRALFPSGYKYKSEIPVPLDKARELKGATIALLFVGRVTDAKLINGRPLSTKATFSSPTEMLATKPAVPFELKKIVYYVIETGEILGEKSF